MLALNRQQLRNSVCSATQPLPGPGLPALVPRLGEPDAGDRAAVRRLSPHAPLRPPNAAVRAAPRPRRRHSPARSSRGSGSSRRSTGGGRGLGGHAMAGGALPAPGAARPSLPAPELCAPRCTPPPAPLAGAAPPRGPGHRPPARGRAGHAGRLSRSPRGAAGRGRAGPPVVAAGCALGRSARDTWKRPLETRRLGHPSI